MRDVASAAAVSTMTVSNVVNGRSARVGEATRQRVLEAIDQLGYRVNPTARSLRRGRTGVIGLAVPDIAAEYYGELAGRLARRLREHGFRLAVESTGGDLVGELDTLAASRLDTYDALVLAVAAGDVEDLDRLQPDKPVVLVGERAIASRYHHVVMDNVGGARLATGHLLDRGARAVVALGGIDGDHDSVQELRVRGYREAHAERGLDVDPGLIVEAALAAEEAGERLSALLAGGAAVDGVFALTDSAATGALRALADRGLRVPHDVVVIGFDNVTSSRFTVPSLSTIEPGNDEMADAVCSMLLAQLDRASDGGARLAMPRPHLVVRQSTGADADRLGSVVDAQVEE